MKTITTKDWIDLINENKQLHTQLAKANEREKDFIAYLHDAQKWFDKHDPNGHLQSSHPKAVKALNKFALEQQIKVLEEIVKNYRSYSLDGVILTGGVKAKLEQLRKEQNQC